MFLQTTTGDPCSLCCEHKDTGRVRLGKGSVGPEGKERCLCHQPHPQWGTLHRQTFSALRCRAWYKPHSPLHPPVLDQKEAVSLKEPHFPTRQHSQGVSQGVSLGIPWILTGGKSGRFSDSPHSLESPPQFPGRSGDEDRKSQLVQRMSRGMAWDRSLPRPPWAPTLTPTQAHCTLQHPAKADSPPEAPSPLSGRS